MKSTTIALAALLSLAAFGAQAQTWTFKVGASQSTSGSTSDLSGTTAITSQGGAAFLGTQAPAGGLSFKHDSKLTSEFSIERAFGSHWSAELVLGQGADSDLTLQSSSAAFTPITASGILGTMYAQAARAHFQSLDGSNFGAINRQSTSAFLNYTFLDAKQSIRPFAGLGYNRTHFSADANATAASAFSDGPVNMSMSDSSGLTAQVGVRYQPFQHFVLSAAVVATDVKSDLTLTTAHASMTSSYSARPVSFKFSVGYTF